MSGVAPAVERGKFYAGDLRADLVRASLDLIAANGPDDFSVAKVARTLGVSSAAPYRHFSDRTELLAAVAAKAAAALRTEITLAAAGAPDPVEVLAAATGAYTRFVIERRVDLPIIFSSGSGRPGPAARRLLAEALSHCRRVVPGREPARALLEQLVAQANGFAFLHLGHLRLGPAGSAAEVAARSTKTARALIRHASGAPRPGDQEES